MTLTEFLLARIAEDEADARAAIDDDEHWLHVGDGRIVQGSAGFTVSSGWITLPHRFEAADHVARHDPARVLAECEAKRRIVGMADLAHEWSLPTDRSLFHVLLDLALPYADHPDYDEAWKP